jgi:UDP:flavonoid glycosyltransferase YjiC (YdhE family)
MYIIDAFDDIHPLKRRTDPLTAPSAMRLLFCAFDNPGHLFPLVGLALELRGRGHEVAFVARSQAQQTLDAAGLPRIGQGEPERPSFRLDVHEQPEAIENDVRHLEAALRQFSPDALVTHQLAHAPVLVRERARLPVAVMGFFSYLWSWSPASAAAEETSLMDRARRELVEHDAMVVSRARARLGMPLVQPDGADLPFLGDLFMLRTVPELQPQLSRLPPQVHTVGGCVWEPPHDAEREWDALRESFAAAGSPIVYVQHGRTFSGSGFWPELVEALADRPVQVVASVARMEDIGRVPANFVARSNLSQGLVLPHARAAVSGGHSTVVLGTLVNGVPSVLIPAGGETSDNAETLQHAGCAIGIAKERLTVDFLVEAVDAALHGDRLRGNAQRLARAFARTPPFAGAADLVERMAASGTRVDRDPREAVAETAAS